MIHRGLVIRIFVVLLSLGLQGVFKVSCVCRLCRIQHKISYHSSFLYRGLGVTLFSALGCVNQQGHCIYFPHKRDPHVWCRCKKHACLHHFCIGYRIGTEYTSALSSVQGWEGTSESCKVVKLWEFLFRESHRYMMFAKCMQASTSFRG